MMYVSNRAAEQLKQELVQKCLESGLGFRLIVGSDESGKVTSAMKFDKIRQNDRVIDLGSVPLFSDDESVSRIKDFHLDYESTPSGGFFLKKVVHHSRLSA